MTTSEHEYSADERFERLLLDSARSDELPHDTDAAWQKFDSALRGVSLLAAGTSSALAARKAQRWLAAKWLIWGALAGSALTALSLRPRHTSSIETRAALATPVAASIITSGAPSAQIEVAAPLREPTIAPVSAAHKPFAHSPRARPSASAAQAIALPTSTLAAQVALLDAARTAFSSGAHAEALRLADHYRADFPNGELAPEAEVVAIEALVARGSRTAASERAARFLARFPGDPHAARVQWLVR